MNIKEYLKGLNEDSISKFIKATKSNLTIQKSTYSQVSDTSWIDMVEECIPYLDSIIRNPRSFIVQEENIVPIEKAKVVTEESIKHLAQNTNLIQEVHEDGTVIPLKLLNVYREDTVNLYENRFIKSLVDNLYLFVNNKLKESDQKSFCKVSNKVSYSATLKGKKETVDIKVDLNSNYHDEQTSLKDGHSLDERIANIRDILAAFKSSQFIKQLKESAPVRSPIRKTNVILKDPNFMKALELWEYLEKNNIKPITETNKTSEEIKDNNIKDLYDLAFFIENDSLKNGGKEHQSYDQSDIGKLIYDLVLKNDISDTEFKNLVLKEFKEAKKAKAKIINQARKTIDNFWQGFEKNRDKAYKMFK